MTSVKDEKGRKVKDLELSLIEDDYTMPHFLWKSCEHLIFYDTMYVIIDDRYRIPKMCLLEYDIPYEWCVSWNMISHMKTHATGRSRVVN